ncbi:MAG: hypothetical protein M3N95_11525 [Actinomycetota bacterium]|nr:hypothetical protein [Actinomycetota bacterium]
MQPGPSEERSAREAERSALETELAAEAAVAARVAPSLRPASLVSTDPLRPLPGALLAKLEIRGRAGYDPTGPDHPRRDRWQQLLAPGLGLAAAAALVLIVAVIAGHSLLAEIAGAALAAGALATAAAWRWIEADPLRIRPAERHALTAAGWWQSRQAWTGTQATGPERALLSLAVEVVAEIASSPAWRSGYLDAHRLVFDLAAELDAVDAQAFGVAQARTAGRTRPDADAAFESCVDRILALRRYANRLAELTERITAADTEIHAAPAIGELRGDVEQGRYAVQGIARLTEELGVISASVEATAAELRRERD